MNTRILKNVLVIVLLTSTVSLADRLLDSSETLSILKTLTDAPHKTWISAGTIVATHEEYRAKSSVSNEYRMNTNVTVRFDGERFYWQIDVSSRIDSVGADPNLANAAAMEQFDMNGNRNRIFAWDGQKYSTYYRPVNIVVINDAAKNQTSPAVNGPLTAGCIPWGYGYYTYEELSAATSRGIATTVEGRRQIQLTLDHPSGLEMTFVLDPEKNYAVLSHSIKKANGSIAVKTYGNFLQIGGKWIPTTIMLEQYNYFVAPQNLAASDMWNFTSIDRNTLAEDSFKINYEADAMVEYHNAVTAESLIYRYSKASPASKGVDSDELLIDKFDSDAVGNELSKNCATAAIKYVTSKLGRGADRQQLAQLAQNSGPKTNLYAMKQFVTSMGFYCRAVKTDVKTLKDLTGCQAILHLAGKKHYVVLGNIDDTYVRTIDLSSSKFFDRFSMDEFSEEWQGTALLISNQPINVNGTLTDIDVAALQNIVGAGYSCTKVLQVAETFNCSEAINGDCGGTYRAYSARSGCTSDVSGTCSMSVLMKYFSDICITNPEYPAQCDLTGEEIAHYMRACR